MTFSIHFLSGQAMDAQPIIIKMRLSVRIFESYVATDMSYVATDGWYVAAYVSYVSLDVWWVDVYGHL